MNKTNTLKKTTKLIFRSAIIIFILLPALMILMPACNSFGQCGKPGYSYYWSGCYMYVTWSCDSPCSPSTTHMTLHATAVHKIHQQCLVKAIMNPIAVEHIYNIIKAVALKS